MLAIALGSVALALGLARLGGSTRAHTPLALAPAGSSIVVHLDVPALLRSPLWEALAGDDVGLAHVREACGFDPLARLRTAEIFVVGTTRRPLDQVGFVARGDLPREELVRCVELVVEEDGGGVHAVEIEGVPALASDHGASRAAFLAPDGVVAGDETIVREILRIDHGTARGSDDDASFRRLWTRVATREEIVAVARIPERWRGAIERAVARMDGLESLADVVTVGLGARLRDGLGATVVLEMEGAGDARTLEAGLRARIEAARADVLVRLSTVGGALRHVDLEAQERDLVITVDLDEDELEAVVALARHALDELLTPDDGARPERGGGPAATSPEALVPDEIVTPEAAPSSAPASGEVATPEPAAAE